MRLIKAALLTLAAFTVMPIHDWFEDLKDKERLRVVNERRKRHGEPPFDNLWQYYRSLREWEP